MNPTLLKVIQEGIVAVSMVAIKAVLSDPEAREVFEGDPYRSCTCDGCEQ